TPPGTRAARAACALTARTSRLATTGTNRRNVLRTSTGAGRPVLRRPANRRGDLPMFAYRVTYHVWAGGQYGQYSTNVRAADVAGALVKANAIARYTFPGATFELASIGGAS